MDFLNFWAFFYNHCWNIYTWCLLLFLWCPTHRNMNYHFKDYTIEMHFEWLTIHFNSLTIMQRCERCEQWNTFRNCNDEIVDFRHRLFLYFAAYLIYLGTTFRDNMTGNNCTFSKQTFLWRHFEITNKHNAELQRTDPGTKLTGKFLI